MRRGEPLAERELRVHAVDAGDVRIGDQRDCALAGDELRELLERAEGDVDACGGQDDVVQRARDRVGRLAVERQPLLVERAKAALVLRQRPSPAAHALPGGVGSTSTKTVRA